MKHPKEAVLVRDKYGTKIILYDNGPDQRGFDLQTDGRVYLSPTVAWKLAQKLMGLIGELSR